MNGIPAALFQIYNFFPTEQDNPRHGRRAVDPKAKWTGIDNLLFSAHHELHVMF